MSRWWARGSGESQTDTYDERWQRLEAAGGWVHGEADLVSWFEPASVLDAGCGTGRVAVELDRRGVDVVGVDIDAVMLEAARRKAPHVQWILGDLRDVEVPVPVRAEQPRSDIGSTRRRSFDLVVMAGNVIAFVAPGTEAAVVANMAAHLGPSGRLVSGFSLGISQLTYDAYDRLAADAGLVAEHRWSTWDRERYDGGSYAVTVHRRAAQ